MACGADDVSFSASAGANVTEPLCSAWGWGNPVEEDLALRPGYWESKSLLNQMKSMRCGGNTVGATEAGAVVLKVVNVVKAPKGLVFEM